MQTTVDRFEIKQKSPEEYGIKDHKTDKFIIILHTKEYDHIKTTLVQLKNIIDEAILNGDLDI